MKQRNTNHRQDAFQQQLLKHTRLTEVVEQCGTQKEKRSNSQSGFLQKAAASMNIELLSSKISLKYDCIPIEVLTLQPEFKFLDRCFRLHLAGHPQTTTTSYLANLPHTRNHTINIHTGFAMPPANIYDGSYPVRASPMFHGEERFENIQVLVGGHVEYMQVRAVLTYIYEGRDERAIFGRWYTREFVCQSTNSQVLTWENSVIGRQRVPYHYDCIPIETVVHGRTIIVPHFTQDSHFIVLRNW